MPDQFVIKDTISKPFFPIVFTSFTATDNHCVHFLLVSREEKFIGVQASCPRFVDFCISKPTFALKLVFFED
jgi:hypothetical protein